MPLSLNVFSGRSGVSSGALEGHHFRICCCKSCILYRTTPHSIQDIYRGLLESVVGVDSSIAGRSSFLTVVVEGSVVSWFSF